MSISLSCPRHPHEKQEVIISPLSQLEEEIVSEFKKKFTSKLRISKENHLNNSNAEPVISFLRSSLQSQREAIVKIVMRMQKSAEETMGKAGEHFCGYNSALEDTIKELKR